MMLRMSCARRDASRDRIEVVGILSNDGRGCGSREKFFQSLMGSRRKLGREKFTTLVARVSLVYRNARPPVM